MCNLFTNLIFIMRHITVVHCSKPVPEAKVGMCLDILKANRFDMAVSYHCDTDEVTISNASKLTEDSPAVEMDEEGTRERPTGLSKASGTPTRRIQQMLRCGSVGY